VLDVPVHINASETICLHVLAPPNEQFIKRLVAPIIVLRVHDNKKQNDNADIETLPTNYISDLQIG